MQDKVHQSVFGPGYPAVNMEEQASENVESDVKLWKKQLWALFFVLLLHCSLSLCVLPKVYLEEGRDTLGAHRSQRF